MTNAHIPKSPIVFDPDTFRKLLELHRTHRWITDKEKPLLHLMSECNSPVARDLVITLLSRFRYFDLNEAQVMVASLVSDATDRWELNPDSTFFAGISDSASASSGQLVLNWAKHKLAATGNWQKDRFLNDCPRAAHEIVDGGAIVFVDDFVGTGRTLARKSEWVRKQLGVRKVAGVRIFLIALSSMQGAKTAIMESTEDSQIGEYLVPGISGYSFGTELDALTAEMLKLENRLSPNLGRRKMPSFGYAKSESLYSLNETSTPNNVFPIFWWPVDVHG